MLCSGCRPAVDPTYAAEIEAWHRARIERLRAPDGWLSLVGLFWLEPGRNLVGSDSQSEVVLPLPAPPRVGEIVVQGMAARFVAAPEVKVMHAGSAVSEVALLADHDREPTVLEVGATRFYLIERQGRLAVRAKDPMSGARRDFRGIERFPVDPRWRVEARFEPHAEGSTITIASVTGGSEEQSNPGAAVFERDGSTHRLQAVAEGDELFFVFADLTSGKETYGAGRFLYTALPAHGRVILDFNQAYNPPCAFTPYATCPLPPKANRLTLRVTAGEKRYAH